MFNYGNMIMADQFRKVEPYSPKSSPRGGRSPIVSRQDSSGTLKTTISLGKNPSIVNSGPFYLMKEPPGESELTGATNLMTYYGLDHSYIKFSGKKLKEQLSSFLPNLPGVIDGPGQQDNSSLRSVIEKPPIVGKELQALTSLQLAGFRLHPGPLPEQYRYLNTAPAKKHKNKHKKHKHKDGVMLPETSIIDASSLDTHEKKHKKQKRHEDDKERKKRKKEKKRKKQRHSPEHSTSGGGGGMLGVTGGANSSGPTGSNLCNTGGGPSVSNLGIGGGSGGGSCGGLNSGSLSAQSTIF